MKKSTPASVFRRQLAAAARFQRELVRRHEREQRERAIPPAPVKR